MEKRKENSLARMAAIQTKVHSFEQFFNVHHPRQEKLVREIQESSRDLVCQLRLVSLIRHWLMTRKRSNVEKIVGSQTLRGLSFAVLEYCPSFCEPNLLSQYTRLISIVRGRTSILAKLFYYFSVKYPERMGTSAFSLFPTLFQHGWCVEEDGLMADTLIDLAEIQFEKNLELEWTDDPNRLKTPQVHSSQIVKTLEPLATFCTSYLLNGSCFAFLGSAFDGVISSLYSLSSLRDLRNQFTKRSDPEVCGAFDYWTLICQYALQCFKAMMSCVELLPPGASRFFKFIRDARDGDKNCLLLFFESFVNRALENCAIMGIVPWHPESYSDRSPLSDIATVFRKRYQEFLGAKKDRVFNLIEPYNEMDMKQFLDVLTTIRSGTLLISECELINTNPNFPKELIVNGMDLRLLHIMVLNLPEEETKAAEIEQLVNRLGEVPGKMKETADHFRLVILRKKEVVDAAKSMKMASLFSNSGDDWLVDTTNSINDSYAERLCDLLAAMPHVNQMQPVGGTTTTKNIFEMWSQTSAMFQNESQSLASEAILYYGIHSVETEDELYNRLEAVADQRESRALECGDRSASFSIQSEKIVSYKQAVLSMKDTLQIHLISAVAEAWIKNELNNDFTIAMSKCADLSTDLQEIKETLATMSLQVSQKASDVGLERFQIAKVARIVFFEMMDHITIKRFLLRAHSSDLWKKSVILTGILEKHRREMITKTESEIGENLPVLKKYLLMASDILGYIKPTSGVIVAMFYVIQVMVLISKMKEQIKGLVFDNCTLWVFLSTPCKHIFGVAKFVEKFILNHSLMDMVLEANEIQHLATFCANVRLMCIACGDYDERAKRFWESV